MHDSEISGPPYSWQGGEEIKCVIVQLFIHLIRKVRLKVLWSYILKKSVFKLNWSYDLRFWRSFVAILLSFETLWFCGAIHNAESYSTELLLTLRSLYDGAKSDKLYGCFKKKSYKNGRPFLNWKYKNKAFTNMAT